MKESKKNIAMPRNAVLTDCFPISELMFVEQGDVVRYHSDVYYLINAQRIREQLGEETYLKFIKSLSVAPSPYRPLKEDQKYLDDDLMLRTVKPRSLQHPSEIRAYTESLMLYLDSKAAEDAAAAALKERLEKETSDYERTVSAIEKLVSSSSETSKVD